MNVRDEKDLCEKIAEPGPALLFRAGGSKSPKRGSEDSNVEVVDVSALQGIGEYEASEYTITAAAGTPLQEVCSALAENGQHLPFDPLLVEAGATVGGTLASNASGSGRYRHGGVRDFVLGIRFVDGLGKPITGGARVVKNAAGFDLPKLMAGSLGALGCLTEVTFKVFPAPAASSTVLVHQLDLDAVEALVHSMLRTPYEILAMDLHNSAAARDRRSWTLALRLGGPSACLDSRIAGVESWGRTRALSEHDVEVLSPAQDGAFWRRTASLSWVAAKNFAVKVPITLRRFKELELGSELEDLDRVLSATQQLFLSVPPNGLSKVREGLGEAGLRGQIVRYGLGAERPLPSPILNKMESNPFADRIQQALDPLGRFVRCW